MPGATHGAGATDGPAPWGRVGTEGGPGIDGPRELRHVSRFSHEAMATVFEVHVAHPDERYAAQAAQAAFDLVDRLERELSRFVPNSDIARINHLAAGEHTHVSPSTLECLEIARHIFDTTGGMFDVSIGTGLPSLELDPVNSGVRATRDGVRLDLGGIGKGYAVDLMAELLEEWEVERTLVHGGFSSVLALEAPPDHDGWPLILSDPGARHQQLHRVSARHTAIGASGLRKGDHIVDPRTGRPARGPVAAWVVVPRPEVAKAEAPHEGGPRVAAAAVADALATAFMLMSPEEVETLCARSPGLEAWVLGERDGHPPGDVHLRRFGGGAG